MIISHRHKFIFFAVPKTATHSIREALRTHISAGDWEQQALLGKQVLPIEEIAQLQHGHITVQQIKAVLAEDVWRSYYKFAFVRNPFDRFVSICFFLNRNNPQFEKNALDWMKIAISRDRFKRRILARPQIEQLADESNQLALDYVGRYEDLQASMDCILDHLQLARVDLNVVNSSAHAGYDGLFDAELRESVATFYAEDLDRFDYVF